jgi:hypothetical protein
MKKLIFILLLSVCFNNAFSQSSKYAGLYKCSDEDIIRLNSNGTGRFIISYVSDEFIEFKWEYNEQRQTITLDLQLTEEQKWKIAIRYLTLDYELRNGKQTLSHSTSGPTFLYVKQ